MTRAEIIRHLEADAYSGLSTLRTSVQPFARPEEVVYALGSAVNQHAKSPPETVYLWRLLLTLLEAE